MNAEPIQIRFFAICLALAVVAAVEASDGFYGSSICRTCHQAEYEAWQGSHHDLAMQHASPQTVLGRFDGSEITANGITSRFFTRDGRFFALTDGPDGELAEFEITYTFGVYPLQQYLVPFPDGRLQALTLAWDSRPEAQGGQRWFDLYPDETISHEDELHWTGRQQNWNYMCADCHSTDFAKGYDVENNRFASAWSEIDVACEACHGPGEKHVAWASKGQQLRAEDVNRGLVLLLRDRAEVTWAMDPGTGIARRSAPLEQGTEVGVCADCHSRRGTFHGGSASDANFLNSHMPAFLTDPLYFADGQIRDEVYVWGSFTQSKMHAAGVTCSDCHDPHSLELRAEGDAVCGQCHLPSKFATSGHSGHAQTSDAPGCLDCHMPERNYMVVDPRRDHSLRVPRPDYTVRYGVPNACNSCHQEESAEWASNAFTRLFPNAAPPHQDWATAFNRARTGLPQAELSLVRVFADTAAPDIVRATAVIELASFLSPVSGQAVEEALADPSPLVRLAALRTLEVLPPEHRFGFAGRLLEDANRSVRLEAGRVLAATPGDSLDELQNRHLSAALDEYVASQMYNADRPEAWMNLGNLRFRQGDTEQALADYGQALKLAPDFAPAWLNLADVYRFLGQEDETEKTLEAGLARRPDDAALNHALGLSQVRNRQPESALEPLRRAVELDPAEPRYAYVLAVALNSAGQPGEAVATLTTALGRVPANPELMQLLALIERDRGNYAQARRWGEEILALNPADQSVQEFLRSLPPDQP